MNEAETCAEQIDPALKAAGWGVVEGSKILREYPITPSRIEGHGRRGKPLIADYVLVYRNRKLGVVEAKALDEELTEGVAQAKNYAGKLAVRYAYSTNGQGIYQVDIRRTSLTSSSLMSSSLSKSMAGWRPQPSRPPLLRSGMEFQHSLQRVSDGVHALRRQTAQTAHKALLGHGSDLKGVSGRGFRQPVLRGRLQTHHPRSLRVAVFPVGNGDDDFERENPNLIVVYDHGRARLLHFRAQSGREIDEPDFTALHGNPRSPGR
jgi:hypothetical protein